MSSKINPSVIDIDNLDDITADEFFEKKERIVRTTKVPEASKENFGHKKQTKRIPTQKNQ
jgi:hypothetical protein